MAIGKPSAADVATALWIRTLWRPRYGIEMKPPPAPSRLDIAPMPAPTPNKGAFPGSSRPGMGLLTISIRVAENQTNTPNTAANARVGNALATCGPMQRAEHDAGRHRGNHGPQHRAVAADARAPTTST